MSQVAMVSHTSTRPSCTLLHQAVVYVKATVLSGDPHIARLGYCCSAPPQTLPSLAQLSTFSCYLETNSGDIVYGIYRVLGFAGHAPGLIGVY